MERTWTTVFAVIAIAGLVVIVFSFLPWIDFPGTARGSLHGNDVAGITDIGDGYLTTALGALTVALAIAGIFRRNWSRLLLPALGAAGLGIFVVATRDALTDWQTNRSFSDVIDPVDGDITAFLWALTALGLVVALLAGLLRGLLVVSQSTDTPEGDLDA